MSKTKRLIETAFSRALYCGIKKAKNEKNREINQNFPEIIKNNN